MCSVAMIYIPSFIKIGSGIQKIRGEGGNTQTHRETGWRSHMSARLEMQS
jgi:hypothetical protein